MRRVMVTCTAALAMLLPMATTGAAAVGMPPAAAGLGTVVRPATPLTEDWRTIELAAFVRGLFRDVLRREPAPDEVLAWVAILKGGRSRMSVIEGFVLSDESVALIVQEVTMQVLGREARPEEVVSSSGYLRSSDSVRSLQARALALRESFGSMSREAWITKAYLVLTGTKPTAAQISQRSSELESGKPHSEVAQRISIQPAALTWRLDRMFQQLVHRPVTEKEVSLFPGYRDLGHTRTLLSMPEYGRVVQRSLYECYARAMYDDVLQRPAEDAGVAAFSEGMVRGVSAVDTATKFVQSQEYRERVIGGAFVSALGRAPTGAELAEYEARMTDRFAEQHRSVTWVMVHLLDHHDFRTRYAGRAWIARAYELLLGRPVGGDHVDGWLQRLNQVGYGTVAEEIAFSEEGRTRVVSDAYESLLGRQPDPAGLAAWVDRLGKPPSNLAENAEFMAYANEVGGQLLVAQVGKLVLQGLGLGWLGELLFYLGIPDAAAKAERLYALAQHPLHDMDLLLQLLASEEYRMQVSLDQQPPVTRLDVIGIQGTNGWHRSAVSLVLYAEDASGDCCSGVASTEYRIADGDWARYAVPVRLDSQGVTKIGFRSTDVAGNAEVAGSVVVRIDTIPPTITGEPTTQPNAFGWYPGDVVVRFRASDAGSGVAAVTTPRMITAEGKGLSTAGRARDMAGNVAWRTVGGINIDRTPPVATITSPTVTVYPVDEPLAVTWTAVDALSGINTQTATLDGAPVASGQAVDLMVMPPAEHVVSVTAGDRAGNEATASLRFAVTVDADGVAAVLGHLRELGWITSDGTVSSLSAKLAAAGASINRGNRTAARNQLRAFLHAVDTQAGKSMSAAAADLLRADVAAVLASL